MLVPNDDLPLTIQARSVFAPLHRTRTPIGSGEVCSEALGDSGCGFLHRVSCQVSIPRGGFDLAVTRQLADHRQALAKCQRSGFETVTIIPVSE